jgi:hypothetical protein
MEIPSLSVTPSGTRTCPLRGVLRCDEGRKFLTAMPTRDKRFYGCRKDQLSGCGNVIVTTDIIEHCKHARRPPERVPVENMHQLQYAALVPLHAGTVGHTGTSGLPAGTQAAARYGRT